MGGRRDRQNLRQIEELVADHRPGDRPDDPPDPAARTHVVRFELSAEAFARLRQARTVLDDEHGTNLADGAFVATLCNAVLDGASQAEPTGRAKFQIAMTVCERCRQFFAVVDDHSRFAIQQGISPSDDQSKIWSSTGNRLAFWPPISRSRPARSRPGRRMA